MSDIRFPDDVRGWLTETEGRCLARRAEGKHTLEIGSFCGRSTCCMAQTAASVTCIDPFDGRATDQAGDTLAEFHANLARYGLSERVLPYRMTTHEAAGLACLRATPTAAVPQCFDFAFVDGDHSMRAVLYDYAFAVERLSPGGVVAFHDYCNGTCAGVEAAIGSIIAAGAVVLERADSVLVLKPKEVGVPLTFPFLGIPGLGEMSFETHQAATEFRMAHPLSSEMCGQWSALTGNFNRLYASALNAREQHGATHFVMLHSDVAPKAPIGFGDWASVLITYMRAFKLGVISAAVRIKDESGETSTAVEAADGTQVRLRLDQIGGILCSDAFMPGQTLLINTGCMVVDLTQPWSADLLFSVGDERKRDSDGRWAAHFDPEDWRMSRWLHAHGVRYGVTTDIRCAHVGRKVYGEA